MDDVSDFPADCDEVGVLLANLAPAASWLPSFSALSSWANGRGKSNLLLLLATSLPHRVSSGVPALAYSLS